MNKNVYFQNRRDLRLSGVLHLPDDQEVNAYALFAHCFTCSKSINAAVNISNTLAQNGIATLRFDFAMHRMLMRIGGVAQRPDIEGKALRL